MFIVRVWYWYLTPLTETWCNVTPVTNGSLSNVLVFSHFPTLHEDKWCCSPVYVTEILIYCWIEPFPAFLCKINMYLSVWRPFHHTKLHAYTLSLLIKRNVGGGGGGGGGGVTPGLIMALIPLASLWLCMLPLASLWLCYPMQALLPLHGVTIWLCYPWPQYGSVTPGLNMDLLPLAYIYSSCVCVTEILIYCLIEPFPAFLVYN